MRPLTNPIPGVPNFVQIKSTEEKGSDVNLATYLIMDGYEGKYEQSVVISNDSDLALPIEMVRDKLNFSVGVVNPNPINTKTKRNPTPVELQKAATFLRRIRLNALKNSQFPMTLTDSVGNFSKPSTWPRATASTDRSSP